MNPGFWDYIQELVDNSQIEIDRPKGSTHSRFAGKVYPVNYGFLKGTTSIDMAGVDIWVGSNGQHKVVGVLLTVDLFKRDTELKILYDCNDDEIQSVFNFVNIDLMRAKVIKKENK